MGKQSIRCLFRNNGLSIVLVSIFVILLGGQAYTGFCVHNREQRLHHSNQSTFAQYLASAHFLEATFENWESEFLQMAVYVVFTVFLFQKGSAESKDPDARRTSVETAKHSDSPDPVQQGGWRLRLYKHSLSLSLLALFVVSLIGHAVSGTLTFNEQLREHGRPETSVLEFVTSAQFWFESLQNWQSEFLAVAAIVILTIWLRESGSPESKPVTAPHHQTGA